MNTIITNNYVAYQALYDNNLYNVIFRVTYNMKHYPHIGKSSPAMTQCVVSINGVIVSTGEAIQHYKDENNFLIGRRVAAKKAFDHKYMNKKLRTIFWNKVLNDTLIED